MAKKPKLLIYGANGYTGKLISRQAKASNINTVVAGRNQEAISQLAAEFGFDYQVFDISDTAALDTALSEVDVVLNAAGPFIETVESMVSACLRQQCHYLDITGEVDVFEYCASMDAAARQQNIMLLPGVGFDVVPSDCLANYVAAKTENPTHLTIALAGLDVVSKGSARTGAQEADKKARVRRNGVLTRLDKLAVRTFDFGNGPQACVPISWGDVSSAFYSTAIPNIDAYLKASPAMVERARQPVQIEDQQQVKAMQQKMLKHIEKMPDGPSQDQRSELGCAIIAEVTNAKGIINAARLTGPNGYELTATIAVKIVERILEGKLATGYQTPAQVYGADFILEFDGVSREDL